MRRRGERAIDREAFAIKAKRLRPGGSSEVEFIGRRTVSFASAAAGPQNHADDAERAEMTGQSANPSWGCRRGARFERPASARGQSAGRRHWGNGTRKNAHKNLGRQEKGWGTLKQQNPHEHWFAAGFETARDAVIPLFGGESGIRTRGGLLAPTRFPGVRLKPLIHLSGASEFSLPRGRFGGVVDEFNGEARLSSVSWRCR